MHEIHHHHCIYLSYQHAIAYFPMPELSLLPLLSPSASASVVILAAASASFSGVPFLLCWPLLRQLVKLFHSMLSLSSISLFPSRIGSWEQRLELSPPFAIALLLFCSWMGSSGAARQAEGHFPEGELEIGSEPLAVSKLCFPVFWSATI